jgi:predicted metal-dependent HD superfamily phosphohydrolase
MTWLRDRWLELIAAAGSAAPGSASAAAVDPDARASGTADAAAAGDDLIARWSEPQRHYHTLTHLERMLDVVDAHAAAADDPRAVALACWFHDAVYDPTRGDNETASADLARSVLTRLDVDPAEVVRLVLLTATHAVEPGDRNGALLVDADLAILATDASTYSAYTTAVRAEYQHVSDEMFSRGRAAILRRLLDLPRLFHTPELHDKWEAAARANLRAELDVLDGGDPTL